MLETRIKIIGSEDTEKQLRELFGRLENPKKPFEEIAKDYKAAVRLNFFTHGRTFGEDWPPLSEVTIRIKRRLMEKGKAISLEPLIRTGDMFYSLGHRIQGKTLEVVMPVRYSRFHQYGINVPKRVIMKLDEQRKREILLTMRSWVVEEAKAVGLKFY